MFAITGGKGFQMKFTNGWTVSVQFGEGNYCERKYTADTPIGGVLKSADAEIGYWFKDEPITVIGWRSPEQVATIIADISGR